MFNEQEITNFRHELSSAITNNNEFNMAISVLMFAFVDEDYRKRLADNLTPLLKNGTKEEIINIIKNTTNYHLKSRLKD